MDGRNSRSCHSGFALARAPRIRTQGRAQSADHLKTEIRNANDDRASRGCEFGTMTPVIFPLEVLSTGVRVRGSLRLVVELPNRSSRWPEPRASADVR